MASRALGLVLLVSALAFATLWYGAVETWAASLIACLLATCALPALLAAAAGRRPLPLESHQSLPGPVRARREFGGRGRRRSLAFSRFRPGP